MQAHYPALFEREMGCTPDELKGWLPGASRCADIRWCGTQGAELSWAPAGRLQLHWQALPPRRIALVTLPRLSVRFDFGDCDETLRQRFMKHFDLYTQRGGG